MNAIPLPNADEVRDNATFEALMWALARPGHMQTLPEPGLAAVAQALVDMETAVFTDDATLVPVLTRTGARSAPEAAADYLFLNGDPLEAARSAQIGTGLDPEAGATLVVRAPLSGGPRLRLTGPGIDGAVDIAPVLPVEFWSIRDRRAAYPLGFDLFCIAGDRVFGLPRSTKAEVL